MKTATELYLAFLDDADLIGDLDMPVWATVYEPAFVRLIEAAIAEERARCLGVIEPYCNSSNLAKRLIIEILRNDS